MNGARVGSWSLSPQSADTLEYDPAWTRSEQGRPLSLSLPFQPGNAPHRGEKVSAYFANLLPDSQAIRERLARKFNTGSTAPFDLLSEIGRDCVGALEVLPPDVDSASIPALLAEPMSEAEVAQALRDVTTNTFGMQGDEEDFRISMAGAQEKTALLLMGDQWCLPRGPTPTTHIFKLPLGIIGGMKLDMRNSVDNEWLCSLILKEFGLPVATCMPMQFEDVKALVVERFDRLWWTNPSGDRRLIRLPQEDMCQATGVPPNAKYEADGGPGMGRILEVLDGSITREQDRRDFFKAQLLFWMLCATDGHAKNFSLHLRAGGRYQMTPLYDVLSAYPVLGQSRAKISPFKVRLAMAVKSKNAHWRMRDIQRRHWLTLAQRHGILSEDGGDASRIVDQIAMRTPEIVARVKAFLPPGFDTGVADSILDGMTEAASRLMN